MLYFYCRLDSFVFSTATPTPFDEKPHDFYQLLVYQLHSKYPLFETVTNFSLKQSR